MTEQPCKDKCRNGMKVSDVFEPRPAFTFELLLNEQFAAGRP